MKDDLDPFKSIPFIKTDKQLLAFFAACNLVALISFISLLCSHVEWDTPKIALVVICMSGSFVFPLIYFLGKKSRQSALLTLFATLCFSVVFVTWSGFQLAPIIKLIVFHQPSPPGPNPTPPNPEPPNPVPPNPTPTNPPSPTPPPPGPGPTNTPPPNPGATNPPFPIPTPPNPGPTNPTPPVPTPTNPPPPIPSGPILTVSTNLIDYGIVLADGTTATNVFTVSNTGNGILTGTASTTLPFKILSGASYSLAPNESQMVQVVYDPVTAWPSNNFVILTGGGGGRVELKGLEQPAPPTLIKTSN